MRPQKKIAVLYPLFMGGGAELVAAWMLEALKDHYQVSLVTYSAIDFKQLNYQFGTHLDETSVRVLSPNGFTKSMQNMRGYSLLTIRQHLLEFYFQKIRSDFDLAIAAFNEMDLGQPGIQYIHVPLFGHGNETARRLLEYPTSLPRTIYQRLCEMLTGYSDRRMKSNLTLTNSHWTADIIKRSYNIDPTVIYPPVVLAPPDHPWSSRENGFICSGRISPDKNIEAAVEIISRLRHRGHEVHLHLLSGSFDPAYRRKILLLRDQNYDWFTVQENLSRSELGEILARHRYGIHARANETLGLSIAEMAFAGCIPFVPSRGGQIEVIGNNPALQFATVEEAVEKIIRVLDDPDLQSTLAGQLSETMDRFHPNHFCRNVRICVENFLDSM